MESYTRYFMEALCFEHFDVKISAVSVVSHLHNSKSIRDNGSITVLAFLHNDECKMVSQAVNSFFAELINTSGSEEILLNTIIPDVITRFTEILQFINNEDTHDLKYMKNINLFNILNKKFELTAKKNKVIDDKVDKISSILKQFTQMIE